MLRRSFARVGISYGYDTSTITALNEATRQQFEFLNFQGLGGPNSLAGIKTSRIIPSYTYNTIDHPITPSRGKSLFISTSIAGGPLGGNVNMIEPTVDFKYFRPGFKKGHVIGMHALGRILTGYGGKVAPPFNRYHMGGENDIRGFDIWGITPVAFIPSEWAVDVVNDDGSARMQKVIGADGKQAFAPVRQRVPIYQAIYPGGDTQVVTNFEYRIPIAGPVTLAAFFDAGVNRITMTNQLKVNPSRIDELNNLFPQAGFTDKALIAPGTQKIRTSTGLELQIMMPVVNAPFRLYWAYNPTIVQDLLQQPVVADRSYFPNQATFLDAVGRIGRPLSWMEQRSTFRFTISRTF
jgi:outer membrane protein insertion porin family